MRDEGIAAILFGMALGDALGYPVEFMRLPDIKLRYGPQGIQEPPDPALYTDDTQMTVALLEGLLDAGVVSALDRQMTPVGRRFIEWLHSPWNNRAPGVASTQGVMRLETGVGWQNAGDFDARGSGAAMRVAPLGWLYQHDPARLKTVVEAASIITHRHPAAVAAAHVVAWTVKLALDGIDESAWLPQIMTVIDGMSEDMEAALRRIGHVAAWSDEEAALAHLGVGWVADEIVAQALYCVIRYPNDYVACVRRAANVDGDSDTVACIAGAISGARLGFSAIPETWRARCENRTYLEDLAVRLSQARKTAAESTSSSL